MINASELNGGQLNEASSQSLAQELFAQLDDTSIAAVAVHEPNSRLVEDIAGAGSNLQSNYALTVADRLTADSATELFYNPRPNVTSRAEALITALPAQVEKPVLAGAYADTPQARIAIPAWLTAQSVADLQIIAYLMASPALNAGAADASTAADALKVTDSAEGATTHKAVQAAKVTDRGQASLVEELTLEVEIEERLEAEAGDSVEVLAHYLQNVTDQGGAYVTFKVSGALVQGWVMNLEGENPISEYRGFDFNSFARIGGTYFAASDSGIYRLGGDTDNGEQIDAHIRTMMHDFGSTAQKRVVAAYLGYTSSGTMVLKVRSVDQGQLVEHWYEAQEVTADAPRENFRTLGRGLKSRYWQFELANVDGADFEIDQLQLQPIMLKRRV